MLLYLDTRDLINILERSEPLPRGRLLNLLQANGHRLVISFGLIAELAGPLRHPKAKTNVMALINHLEEFPLCFIGDVRLEFLEFKEAVDAWGEGRECRSIDPFVPRFDYTLPFDGPPATYIELRSSIAETVFRLWSEVPAIFEGHKQHLELLRCAVAEDRKLPALPDLRKHFPVVLRKRLTQFGLPLPADLQAISNWIFDQPARCPAARLGLEIYRLIVQDRTYTPEASLFEDYSRVKSLPYVDLLTLDKHMADCLRRACRAVGLSYHEKVHTDAQTAIRILE